MRLNNVSSLFDFRVKPILKLAENRCKIGGKPIVKLMENCKIGGNCHCKIGGKKVVEVTPCYVLTPPFLAFALQAS